MRATSRSDWPQGWSSLRDGDNWVTNFLRNANCVATAPYVGFHYEHDVCMGEDTYTVQDIQDSAQITLCVAGAALTIGGRNWAVGLIGGLTCAVAFWDQVQ